MANSDSAICFQSYLNVGHTKIALKATPHRNTYRLWISASHVRPKPLKIFDYCILGRRLPYPAPASASSFFRPSPLIELIKNDLFRVSTSASTTAAAAAAPTTTTPTSAAPLRSMFYFLLRVNTCQHSDRRLVNRFLRPIVVNGLQQIATT